MNAKCQDLGAASGLNLRPPFHSFNKIENTKGEYMNMKDTSVGQR